MVEYGGVEHTLHSRTSENNIFARRLPHQASKQTGQLARLRLSTCRYSGLQAAAHRIAQKVRTCAINLPDSPLGRYRRHCLAPRPEMPLDEIHLRQ